MKHVRILIDSTSDLPAEVARKLGITVVSAYVQMEGQSLRDGDQITRAEFYQRLANSTEAPTTAVPPAYDFATAFRNLSDQADEIVAILISIKLSGMLNAARLGSREVPETEVYLVDSGQVSMGTGWQAIIAAEAAAEGKGAEEIVSLVQQVQPRIRLLAMLDTLEYLRRSGRVAWARAAAADLLHIKPLIEVREGEVVMVGKVRTRRKAIERLLEMTAALGPLERLAVLHTQAPDVESFRTRLGSLFPVEQILVSEIGPIVGTHVGPCALGIAAVVA
jgi:DegV family protein with EDD domain